MRGSISLALAYHHPRDVHTPAALTVATAVVTFILLLSLNAGSLLALQGGDRL